MLFNFLFILEFLIFKSYSNDTNSYLNLSDIINQNKSSGEILLKYEFIYYVTETIVISHSILLKSISINNFSNVVFKENGALVIKNKSTIILRNINFTCSDIKKSTTFLIQNFKSEILIDNCYFSKMYIDYNDFIFFENTQSNLSLKNCYFYSNNFTFKNFIKMSQSILNIENTTLMNNKNFFENDFIFLEEFSKIIIKHFLIELNIFACQQNCIIFNSDYLYLIDKIIINDNIFNKITIFKNYFSKDFIIFLMNNSIFSKTVFSDENSILNLSMNIFSDFIIKNIKFINIISNNYLLYISNTNGLIYLSNLKFEYCYSKESIYIILVNQIFLENLFFLNQNNSPEIIQNNDYYGACIYLMNILKRIIEKITIKNSKSLNTTIGIKIIDSIKDNNFIKSGLILLNELYFYNNSVFYVKYYETSGLLYILSENECYLINSHISHNSLNAIYKVDRPIGGPCLNLISLNNTLIIKNSTFEDNKSKFYSNCIEFIGNQINISYSYFYNNSMIYDEEEENLFKKLEASFSRKSSIHYTGKGGAVSSKCSFFYIENVYFYKNIAFQGGAFLIHKYKKLVIIIIYCIFKQNEGGMAGGAVAVLSTTISALITLSYFKDNDGLFGNLYFAHLSVLNNITITSNFFYDNKGEFSSCITIDNIAGTIYQTKNIFISNKARLYPGKQNPVVGIASLVFGKQILLISNENIYIDNTSDNGGGVLMSHEAFIICDSEFIYNTIVKRGGGVYLASAAIAIFKNSIIIISISFVKGGAFMLTDYSNGTFYNVKILDAKSFGYGGILYIQENSNFIGYNLIIINSNSDEGGIASVLDNPNFRIIFRNVSFINCSSIIGLFTLLDGNLFIENCSFFNTIGTVFNLKNSNLSLINSEINNVQCFSYLEYGCVFDIELNSYLTMKNSLIYNISALTKGSLIYSFLSQFYLMNSTIILVSSTVNSGAFYLQLSFIVINITGLYDFKQGFIDNINTELIIETSIFNNSNFYHNDIILEKSQIYIENSQLILINNCFFSHNKIIENGAFFNLYNDNKLNKENIIIFSKDKFFNGEAHKLGGAIYSINYNISIFNCSFLNNNALYGGSIYFKIESENLFIFLTISYSNFSNNYAIEGGGAIYWLNSKPNLFSNIYINNSGKYGNDLASNAMRINLILSNYSTDNLWNEYFNTKKNKSYKIIENLASGQKFKDQITLKYLDYYNQTVKSLDNMIETVSISYDKLIESEIDNNLTLIGSNNIKLNKGILTITDFVLIAAPNSKLYLILNSKLILLYSKYLNNWDDDIFYRQNNNNKYKISIPIIIRQCNKGEVYLRTMNLCQLCEFGKYSYDPNDKECIICPKQAICYGGDHLEVLDGFWRRDQNSNVIYNCYESNYNCLGGKISTCNTNFYGPLCRTCVFGSYKVNSDTCLFCEKASLNIIRIIGFCLLSFIMVILLIKSAFDNLKNYKKLFNETDNYLGISSKRKLILTSNIQSLYVKILLNYLQMMSLVDDISVDWPGYITELFYRLQYVTTLSNRYMGFECIFNYSSYEEIRPYLKFLCINFLPFVLLMVSIILWIILKVMKKIDSVKEKIYVTLIGIYFMIQPNVLSECLNLLLCIKIDDNKLIKNEPAFSCENETYKRFSFYLAWPLFSLWAFAIPIMLLTILYRNKNHLYEPKMFQRASFLYIGYKMENYYWDIFIMFRKSFCALILLMVGSNDQLKLLVYILIIGIYLENVKTRRPFLSIELNFLEFISVVTAILTIYLTMVSFFLENNTLKICCYFLILIINCFFISYWSYLIFMLTKRNYFQYKQSFLMALKYGKSVIDKFSPKLSNKFSNSSFTNILGNFKKSSQPNLKNKTKNTLTNSLANIKDRNIFNFKKYKPKEIKSVVFYVK